jgi:hypothetical protein
VTHGQLVWGIRESLLNYIGLLPDGDVTLSEGSRGDARGPFSFTSDEIVYDQSTGEGTMKFGGRVAIEGHGGLLSVVLENPWVELASGEGLLSTVVGGSRTAVARFLPGTPATEADSLEWAACPAYLTRTGVRWLGDQYVEGEEIAPIRILVRQPDGEDKL